MSLSAAPMLPLEYSAQLFKPRTPVLAPIQPPKPAVAVFAQLLLSATHCHTLPPKSHTVLPLLKLRVRNSCVPAAGLAPKVFQAAVAELPVAK